MTAGREAVSAFLRTFLSTIPPSSMQPLNALGASWGTIISRFWVPWKVKPQAGKSLSV